MQYNPGKVVTVLITFVMIWRMKALGSFWTFEEKYVVP